MKFVSALFSFAMLLRTPGYFLRLVENVPKLVEHLLFVKIGEPPAGECLSEFLSFCGIDVSSQVWQEFLAFFNGVRFFTSGHDDADELPRYTLHCKRRSFVFAVQSLIECMCLEFCLRLTYHMLCLHS